MAEVDQEQLAAQRAMQRRLVAALPAYSKPTCRSSSRKQRMPWGGDVEAMLRNLADNSLNPDDRPHSRCGPPSRPACERERSCQPARDTTVPAK